MDELEEYVRLARENQAPRPSRKDMIAERNRRYYLGLIARDPDYYKRYRREQRRERRMSCAAV